MRSRTLAACALFASLFTMHAARAADQIPWQPTIEAAQQIAAQTNRLVLLHFYGDKCGPCVRVDNEVFSRTEVARALEPNFVMVKLNVDRAMGSAQLYGVSSIPTDVIILPNGRLVSAMQSPPTPNQYVMQMNQAAAGYRDLARSTAAVVAPPQGGQPPVAAMPPQGVQQPSAAPGGAQPIAAGPATAPPADRYAEYFQQPAAGAQPAGVAANGAPPITPQAGVAPAPASAQFAAAPGTTMPVAYGAAAPPPQTPPGSPPLGLDGYCPVTLVERQQWAAGVPAFGAIHRGRTYLFLGPAEVKKFLADPDKYSPVLAGNDPVLALDSQLMVPGHREFGVYSDNRVYLFADAASRKKFEENPTRYTAAALQASAGQPPVVR